MAVYKVEKCPACLYKHNESRPGKKNKACPRCGGQMRYSENWYISYRFNGRFHKKSIGPQKTLAQDVLSKIKAQIREGRYFDKIPSVTWRHAVEQFRQWFKVNTGPRTIRMYENSLKILTPHFERYTLDKITPAMVERFKSKRAVSLKPSTVNKDIATIKRLFSLSEDWGLVGANRIRKVKLIKEDNKRTRFLTDEEIESLLNECKTKHLWLAVLIAVETGLRKNDIHTLQWKEIDFANKMIRKAVKGRKKVHIPLTKKLEKALIEHKKSLKVVWPNVLTSHRKIGKPFNDFRKGFHAACKRAGIEDFRFHDLRHTFASQFIIKTGRLRELKEILGHSNIQTTMRYSHLLDEHKKEAMKKFEEERDR